MGSSPLTRGKQAAVPDGCAEHGLIPAHAGKTGCRPRFRNRAGAHPRSRGENLAAGIEDAGFEGSSPLTRGKLRVRRADGVRRGLIPAHAGKTIACA